MDQTEQQTTPVQIHSIATPSPAIPPSPGVAPSPLLNTDLGTPDTPNGTTIPSGLVMEGSPSVASLATQLGDKPQSNSLVPVGVSNNENGCFVDITAYLNLPQTFAAKKLGMPTSTLSKRWREAVRNRKWPYRIVNKLDKEITTLLHNIPQGPGAPPIPEDVQEALGQLLRRRQEELRPVVIRV